MANKLICLMVHLVSRTPPPRLLLFYFASPSISSRTALNCIFTMHFFSSRNAIPIHLPVQLYLQINIYQPLQMTPRLFNCTWLWAEEEEGERPSVVGDHKIWKQIIGFLLKYMTTECVQEHDQRWVGYLLTYLLLPHTHHRN